MANFKNIRLADEQGYHRKQFKIERLTTILAQQ